MIIGPLTCKCFPLINVYNFYYLPILNLLLQQTFCYSFEGEYQALLFDGDFATIPSECDMLTYMFIRGHMCQFDTALYPTQKVSWCLYALFVNDTQ